MTATSNGVRFIADKATRPPPYTCCNTSTSYLFFFLFPSHLVAASIYGWILLPGCLLGLESLIHRLRLPILRPTNSLAWCFHLNKRAGTYLYLYARFGMYIRKGLVTGRNGRVLFPKGNKT